MNQAFLLFYYIKITDSANRLARSTLLGTNVINAVTDYSDWAMYQAVCCIYARQLILRVI